MGAFMNMGHSFLITTFLVSLAILTTFGAIALKPVGACPTWMVPGFSASYRGICTYSTAGFWGIDSYTREANMSWTVENITEKVVFIRQRVSEKEEPGFLEINFAIDMESRLVLGIDGKEPQEETYTFFWIGTDIRNGSLVRIENQTFLAEPGGLIKVGGTLRDSWALKASLYTQEVNGTIIRWYDKETGIQLLVKYNMTIILDGKPGYLETSVESLQQNFQEELEQSRLADRVSGCSYILAPREGLLSTFLALLIAFIGRKIHNP